MEFAPKRDDYRDINQKEKKDYNNIKLNILATHEHFSKLDWNNSQMVFDATSLYPSAMSDRNSVYPKRETGLDFEPHMKDVYVEAFNIQTFNQHVKESAIIILKEYNPPNNIRQLLPVKKKVKNIEVKKMRNGYIIDTLTSVDICATIKTAGKVIKAYEGAIYRETIGISTFSKKFWQSICFKTKP